MPPFRPSPPERTIAQIDERIAELVECIRAQQQRVEEADGEIRQYKQELQELLHQRGSNWSDDHGYARFTSEGIRTSYDTEALDRLILTDPLRYGWLKDYRRESIVPERIQVR